MILTRFTQLSLRTLALTYLGILVALPIGLILVRTFGDGFGAFWDQITTPAAISALSLSLLIVAIVVPVNVVFGIVTALALVRGRFRGRGIVQAVVDLPFAVSPIVVGVSLILLWGSAGWFGFLEDAGIKVIFALPGMVLATIFVTLPFVVREVEPVLHEIGEEQEQAAATLGATRWLADLLAHHPPSDPLGPDLRRRAHDRALARRVRRGDHGVVGHRRRVADADAARPLAVRGRLQHLRRVRRLHAAHAAGDRRALLLMTVLDRRRATE